MLYWHLKTCCGRCRWGSWRWGRWGRWGGGRAARRWSPGSVSSPPEWKGKGSRGESKSAEDRGIGHSSSWITISAHQRLLATTPRSWASHQHPPLPAPTRLTYRPKILKEFYHAGPLKFPRRCQKRVLYFVNIPFLIGLICIWMPQNCQKYTFSSAL